MSLPKETQERIKADAKSERIKWDGKIKEGVTEESRHHFLEGIHDGYIAGATAEAERAQKLVEALKNIKKWCEESGLKEVAIDDPKGMAIYHSLHLSKNALQQWNAGKEVEG